MLQKQTARAAIKGDPGHFICINTLSSQACVTDYLFVYNGLLGLEVHLTGKEASASCINEYCNVTCAVGYKLSSILLVQIRKL